MTEKEVLEKTRELITPEGSWIQGRLAEDIRGDGPINPASPNACRWCLIGAIQRAAWKTGRMKVTPAKDELQALLGVEDLAAWNDEDDRTQGDVFALLDAAISGVEDGGGPMPKYWRCSTAQVEAVELRKHS